ncbi:hypothetical protein J1N35_041255 [Gossypium stocksii]|uniref:Uncharacterized protein n=10 Tax=Gossypium TaxID=3633 RepID=A0A9D3UF50_9ROSI|nr:hypothetical protein J1N35_041255 [Gossypium stocksii]
METSESGFDPTQVIDVLVRVTGGEVGAASFLAPKVDPLGLFPRHCQRNRKGLLEGFTCHGQAKVTMVPSAAALVVKALKEPDGIPGFERMGTCVSAGCTVDRKDPKDVQQEISGREVDVPVEQKKNRCESKSFCYSAMGKEMRHLSSWVEVAPPLLISPLRNRTSNSPVLETITEDEAEDSNDD